MPSTCPQLNLADITSTSTSAISSLITSRSCTNRWVDSDSLLYVLHFTCTLRWSLRGCSMKDRLQVFAMVTNSWFIVISASSRLIGFLSLQQYLVCLLCHLSYRIQGFHHLCCIQWRKQPRVSRDLSVDISASDWGSREPYKAFCSRFCMSLSGGVFDMHLPEAPGRIGYSSAKCSQFSNLCLIFDWCSDQRNS